LYHRWIKRDGSSLLKSLIDPSGKTKNTFDENLNQDSSSLPKESPLHNCDVVILCVGTEDYLSSRRPHDPSHTLTNIQHISKFLSQRYGIRVFLCNVAVPLLQGHLAYGQNMHRNQLITDWIRELEREHKIAREKDLNSIQMIVPGYDFNAVALRNDDNKHADAFHLNSTG